MFYAAARLLGAWGMKQYRIYCLGDEGGFRKVREVEAEGDAAALACARSLKHSGTCEVWTGDRLVGTIPAPSG